jgi:hypothetical protein
VRLAPRQALTLKRQYLKHLLFEFESTESKYTESEKHNNSDFFISSPAAGEDEAGGKRSQQETAPILPSPETGEGNLIPDSAARMVHLARDANRSEFLLLV